MSTPAAVYRPRNPQSLDYYRCVEDHFETFIQVYEERFERQYVFFRSYVQKVICRYLDCGDLHNGFARVKCKDCGHEYLLAFSCKRRHFCPSCHQKRVVEFGEWLCSEVLKKVPHRHFLFSIPKILRRYFLGACPVLDTGCSHIPNRGEQMVRYYGHYSNVSRGKRQKQQADDLVPCIIESDGISREQRRKWSRLIQKIGACPSEGRED